MDFNSHLVSLSKTKKEENRRRRRKKLISSFLVCIFMAQANPKGPSNTHHSQQKKEGEKRQSNAQGKCSGTTESESGREWVHTS